MSYKDNKKPFNIIINARFLNRPVTGVERYAIELVKALDILIEQGFIKSELYSFTMFSPDNLQNILNLKHIKLRQVGKLKGHLWEQLELPLYAGKNLLLNLCNTGPVFKKNQIVTIHDASVYTFPGAYSPAFRIWYKILYNLSGIFAKKIITVSLFSFNELVKYCKINKAKISVIYEGKEHILSVERDTKILERFKIGNRPYVLAVSSLNPNKNFAGIIQAIKLIGKVDFDIVIAGGSNTKVFRHSETVLPDFVKYTGYVSDSELRTLYENAGCFVYPSFYEGFGLPPLEAFACGCPVIVSASASLPEVCKEAAIYCAPNDPADIAGKIKQVMDDSQLRDKLKQLGLNRAKEFSWDKCARETFKLIESLTGNPKGTV